ncbi:CGNR zinc finger domain-containing protein [Actinokineospora auranticolor]|uniref:Putative RNA-binding Zn ribbon-like protein n=1 Tax=Actinokineospora auranticolor TaxID=155976 RepID=A0A2S6GTN8_9PSEU|nr:CGNR zinc finger domain-containing protein [Actinokineospora auranticolor]PPK68553.1 putative RNA-binding Zn ribbon-like protein [Actinokineospora auranticolor]
MSARPLVGEPLSLDLLNTRWAGPSGPHDALDTVDGLRAWLSEADLPGTVDEPTLAALRETRDSILAAIGGDTAGLDAVLDRGRVRLCVEGDRIEVDPAWLPSWLAARHCLDLLTTVPDRIKACAGPTCVLHFLDTSKNGSRRWCSMAGCGNRAKANRHYTRSRG